MDGWKNSIEGPEICDYRAAGPLSRWNRQAKPGRCIVGSLGSPYLVPVVGIRSEVFHLDWSARCVPHNERHRQSMCPKLAESPH